MSLARSGRLFGMSAAGMYAAKNFLPWIVAKARSCRRLVKAVITAALDESGSSVRRLEPAGLSNAMAHCTWDGERWPGASSAAAEALDAGPGGGGEAATPSSCDACEASDDMPG